MKKLIKKWLGIPSDLKERTAQQVLDKMYTQEDGALAFIIASEVRKLFTLEENDQYQNMAQTFFVHNVEKAVKEKCESEIKDFVEREQFIDDIVSRIKQKKL